MRSWFDIKIRGIVGHDHQDLKVIVILGRCLRYTDEGIEFEADPKHMRMAMKVFGLDEKSKGLVKLRERG